MNYGTSFVHPTVQVFFLIKTMVHRILQLQFKGIIGKIALTFLRSWSSITSEHDIGEDFEEVVNNDWN